MSRYMCPYTHDLVCVDEWGDSNEIATDCSNCPHYNNGERWDSPPKSKIWFTADLHVAHTNIMGYEKRPFGTVKEMNAVMRKKWNARVGKDDTVYILGDLASWYEIDIHRLEKYVRNLNGRKILILGNHDKLNAFDYVNIGFESVHTHFVIESDIGPIHLTHDPAVSRVYDQGYWLCGHVHGLFKMAENGRVLNVGVDVWDFEPISLEEVIVEFEKHESDCKEDEQ